MPSIEDLQNQIAELRQLLYNATHGRVGARGIYIGSKRLLADANHLYQEDSDGTKSRLDDVTGEETPKAHGISVHTEHANWKVFFSDGSGDQQEIAVGADGTVFTGTGTSSAPAFEAASGHTHQDAAADDSTKGIATFEADDFDDASGKIDLATAVCKSAPTDSGTATPSTHALTIAGGEGIDTSASGGTVTVAGENASDSNKGVVELATVAETCTGTDTARAVTPDGLHGRPRIVYIKVFGADTAVATGDGKAYITIPSDLTGFDLVDADAANYTASSSGDVGPIQVYNITDSVDMLSTGITIDATEFSSYTAATPPVIDTGNDDVATGDRLRIDVDTSAGTGTQGLDVILVFQEP